MARPKKKTKKIAEMDPSPLNPISEEDVDSLRQDIQSFKLLRTLHVPDYAGEMVVTRDDQYLISPHRNNFKVWNLRTGELLHTVEEGPEGSRRGVVLSRDEKTLYVAGGSEIYSWDFPSLKLRHKSGKSPAEKYVSKVRPHFGDGPLDHEDEMCKEGMITSAVLDPYRQRLHVGRNGYGAMSYWDLTTHEWSSSNSFHGAGGGLRMTNLLTTRNNEILVGQYKQSRYRVWQLCPAQRDLDSFDKDYPILLHCIGQDDIERKSQSKSKSKLVDYWTTSNDGQVLYLAYFGGDYGNADIEQWKIDGFESLGLMQGNEPGIHAMTISPDGKILATGNEKGDVRLWEPSTRTELFNAQLGAWIVDLKFSADSRLLVASVYDNTIQFWGRPGALD
ncbi:MAG: WD40 repeat domain-containing protein [Cyanobacteria bacterium P01_C01_bin.89]